MKRMPIYFWLISIVSNLQNSLYLKNTYSLTPCYPNCGPRPSHTSNILGLLKTQNLRFPPLFAPSESEFYRILKILVLMGQGHLVLCLEADKLPQGTPLPQLGPTPCILLHLTLCIFSSKPACRDWKLLEILATLYPLSWPLSGLCYINPAHNYILLSATRLLWVHTGSKLSLQRSFPWINSFWLRVYILSPLCSVPLFFLLRKYLCNWSVLDLFWSTV